MKYDYNGHEYDGNFFQSKKFGQGTYTSYDDKGNKVPYIGSWKNDNFLGKTNDMWYVTENTDVYKGGWSGGFRNGDGEVTSLKGFTLYKGTFKKDNYHGKGTLYYPNVHLKYAGNFDHGLRDGEGILYNQEDILYNQDGKKVYEGEFQLDKYHGKGTLYYPNGKLKYTGFFDHGLRHGKGILYNQEDILHNQDGKVYEGHFQHDKYHGKGTLYYPNVHLKYDGFFDHGLRHGKGILYNQDGKKVYEGEFQLDKYHGQGKLYDANENLVHEGEWSEGSFVGSPAQKNASCVSQCACCMSINACSAILPLYRSNCCNTTV